MSMNLKRLIVLIALISISLQACDLSDITTCGCSGTATPDIIFDGSTFVCGVVSTTVTDCNIYSNFDGLKNKCYQCVSLKKVLFVNGVSTCETVGTGITVAAVTNCEEFSAYSNGLQFCSRCFLSGSSVASLITVADGVSTCPPNTITSNCNLYMQYSGGTQSCVACKDGKISSVQADGTISCITNSLSVQNCAQYNEFGICLFCSYGLSVLISSTATITCGIPTTAIINCDTYITNSAGTQTCSHCTLGWVAKISSSGSVSCANDLDTNKLANCDQKVVYSSGTSACTHCASGQVAKVVTAITGGVTCGISSLSKITYCDRYIQYNANTGTNGDIICTHCSGGYKAVAASDGTVTCQLPSTVPTIADCSQYVTINGNKVCASCQNGKVANIIASTGSSSCGSAPSPAVTDCSQYTDSKCSFCSHAHSLLIANDGTRTCSYPAASLDNCDQYSTFHGASSMQQCTNCVIGYSVTVTNTGTASATSASCVKSTAIANCNEYITANTGGTSTCTHCLAGLSASISSPVPASNTCSSITTTSNCNQYSSFSGGSLSCSQCNLGTYVLVKSTGISCGTPTTPVTNCDEYSTYTATGTQYCTHCAGSTVNKIAAAATAGSCSVTASSVANCVQQTVYSGTTGYQCTRCAAGLSAIIVNGATSCGSPTTPVANCDQYTTYAGSNQICTHCSNGLSVLVSNTGVTTCGTIAPITTIVTDCDQYTTNSAGLQSCTHCSSGKSVFIPTTGNPTCGTANTLIADCYQYSGAAASATICTRCARGLSVKVASGTTYTCGTPGSIVSNCAKYDATTPFACLGCSTGYSLLVSSTGAISCGAPTTPVTNCIQYTTNAAGVQSCSQCSTGFAVIISSSGLSCGIPSIAVTNCDQYTSYSGGSQFCTHCTTGLVTTTSETNVITTACTVVGTLATCDQNIRYSAATPAFSDIFCTHCSGSAVSLVGASPTCPTTAVTPTVANCDQYTPYTGGTNICTHCANGLNVIISSTGATCGIITSNLVPNCDQYTISASGAQICTHCAGSLSALISSSGITTCGNAATLLADCDQYTTDSAGNTKCTHCAKGKNVINTAGTIACGVSTLTTNVLNCDSQIATTSCNHCAGWFILTTSSSGTITCQAAPTTGAVDNCAAYVADASGTKICSSCLPGFSLLISNGAATCGQPTVPVTGCDQYTTYSSGTQSCTHCADSTKIVNIAISGAVSCITKPTLNPTLDTSCDQLTTFGTKQICTHCSSGNFVLEAAATPPTQTCTTSASQSYLVSNCDQYTTRQKATAGTAICTHCSYGLSVFITNQGVSSCQLPTVPITDCQQYTTDSAGVQSCSQCSRGYSVSVSSSGVSSCVPNQSAPDYCQKFTINSAGTAICTHCMNGLSILIASTGTVTCSVQTIGTAVSNCDQQTATPSTLAFCSHCLNGLSIIIDAAGARTCGTPSTAITNCEQYTSISGNQACSQCTNGFSLITDSFGVVTCSKPTVAVLNCDQYKTQADGTHMCTRCEAGYIALIAGTTSSCSVSSTLSVANCDQFDSTSGASKCSHCRAGFNIYITGGVPSCSNAITTIVSNCDQYTGAAAAAALCSHCINGFTVTTDLVPFCACNSPSSILAVANGPNICSAGSVTGCSTYSTQIVSGSAVIYCSLCTSSPCISNCLVYSPLPVSASSTCVTCATGFYPALNALGKSECVSNVLVNPPHCNQIDTTTGAIKCLGCNLGYFLNYQINQCQKFTLYCTSYKGDVCQRCISGFFLVNSVCITMPSNCTNFDQTLGKCTSCTTGYVINTSGGCSLDLSCPALQYRNFTTNTCVVGQIPNCSVYSTIGDGLCTQCQTGYKLDPIGLACSFVLPTLVCPANNTQFKYIQILNKCVEVNVNCAPFSNLDSGYCYACNTGYYAINGTCISNTQNQNNNQPITSIVINCASDEYLVGTNCIKIPSNCANFNRISNNCLSCLNNLILRNNMCVAQVICPQGSYSSGSNCVPVDTNCVTFNYDSKTCSVCVTGFTRQGASCINTFASNPCPNVRQWYNSTSQRCIEISQTCDTFDKTTGDCLTCFSPYVIIYSGVCGVLDQVQVVTSQCPPGTVEIANQACVVAIANCATYHLLYGYCLTCTLGHFINPVLHTCS